MKSLKFAVLFLFATSMAALAQAPVDVSLFGSVVEPKGETAFEDEFGLRTDYDSGDGFGVAVNWFWGRWVSTELAASSLRAEAGLALEDEEPVVDLGALDLTPLTLTLQFHFARDAVLDPYVGAGLAWVLADDFESADLDALGIGAIDVDDEFTYVLNAGLGVRLTPRLGLYLDGKYIPLEPATRAAGETEDVDLEINPLIVSAGVRLRF